MLFLMVFERFHEKFSLGIFFSPSKPNTIRLEAEGAMLRSQEAQSLASPSPSMF